MDFKRTFLTICIFTLFLLLAAGSFPESKKDEDSTPSMIDLEAKVQFDGAQFTITNNDAFAWTNVKLDVNSGTLSSGYVLEVRRIEAGKSYTVGATQFAKRDGTRLNPVQTKVLNMKITADVPKHLGRKGFWYGEWK